MAKTRDTEIIQDETATENTPQADPMAGLQVYAGPTMHRQKIIGGSVFKNGLPKHIQDLITMVPDVGRMIVPVKDFAAVRKEAETQGTDYHRLYNALLAVRFNENEVRE